MAITLPATRPCPAQSRPAPRARSTFALTSWCVVVAMSLLAAAPVRAQGRDPLPRHSVAIEAGPLGDVLARFAALTGAQIVFEPSILAGRRSEGLTGQFTAQEGFERLLRHSGFVAVEEDSGTYLLRRLPDPPRPEGNASQRPVSSELPVVVVTGQQGGVDPIDPRDGFVVRHSGVGTRVDTSILESPQSISVVGAAEMATLKPQSLMEALGYVAGVHRVEGVDRTTESLLIRGFEAWADNGSLYRDGIRYGVNLNNGLQEPYGLERIEVLKGAASVLYGAAEPGGIVNTVSKQPTRQRLREVGFEAGSFGRRQVTGDFGGPIGDTPDWSYRLTMLARDSDSFVDTVTDDRLYLAPALRWQPSATTSLTFLSEFQKDRTAYVYGLPARGTVIANPNGRIAPGRFQGEPGFDKYDNERGSIGVRLDHRMTPTTRLRAGLRQYWQANHRPFIYSLDWLPGDREVERAAVDVRDRSHALAGDANVEVRVVTGRLTHVLLGGIDFVRQRHSQASATAEVAPLDLYVPVYGSPIGAFTPVGTRRNQDDRVGVYLQDQINLSERWVFLLGGRQDWSHNDFLAPGSVDWRRERSDAFTTRAGIVHLAPGGWAPFVSYSQSFMPTAGADRNNNRFDPGRGEQFEAGLRYQPEGGRTLVSAAIYQLTKSNVTVSDAVDPSYSVQIGRVRSRGLEFEARSRIGRWTDLIAAYAYTDARTVRSSPLTPELDGTRTGGVPYHQLSFWLGQDLGSIDLPGFKSGAGVRHVGATTGSYVTATVPAFTLIDAMLAYETGGWRLALNASNLTNRRYVASCTYGCFYGEPRRVMASVMRRW